jgi:hypothetical protein
MRPRVTRAALTRRASCLLLLAACKPTPTKISPTTGSARGGETVCIQADELSAQSTVHFGERRGVSPRITDDGRLCVLTPKTIAGTVDVRVEGAETPLVFEDGFKFQALALEFTESAAHYLPPGLAEIQGGVAMDIEGDGLQDIVVLDGAAGLVLWLNAGTGAFVEGPPVPVEGAVTGMAVLPWEDGEALFVCHGDVEAPRLLRAEDGRLVEVADAMPLEGSACVGAMAGDVDGDGVAEAVELRANGTLRVWTPAATRDELADETSGDESDLALSAAPLARWSVAASENTADCGTINTDEGVTASCTVVNGVATLQTEGEGETVLPFDLPNLPRTDAGFTLRVGGTFDHLRVTDALGETFFWDPISVSASLSEVRTPPLRSWVPLTEGALPEPPLVALSLVMDAGGLSQAMELELAQVTLHLSDGGRASVAQYETWPADAHVSATALATLDADDDGTPELVAGTAAGPVLLHAGPEAFVSAPVGSLPSATCAVGALVVTDIDNQGGDEIAVACDGQDLLYRGDGTGRFFEDGAASLPVDAGPGADIAAADLDLDGMPELIIATHGGVDRLYHGDGQRFEDWSTRLALQMGTSVAVLPVDIDGDRDLDLVFLQADGAPSRLFVMTGE